MGLYFELEYFLPPDEKGYRRVVYVPTQWAPRRGDTINIRDPDTKEQLGDFRVAHVHWASMGFDHPGQSVKIMLEHAGDEDVAY